MTKLLVSGVSAIVLFASVASAQGYYYPPQTVYPQPVTQTLYGGGCVQLYSDLGYGSRSSEVRTLQTFLVAQNYPGGGSWMITGYFGPATQAAVKNFQYAAGLPQTGFVDASTRAAIQVRTCGVIPPYTPPIPPYHYGVTLTSLSAASGPAGTTITIYGSGFDYAGNAVYGTSFSTSNIPSQNGTSLTVTIPSYATGVQQLYVKNSRGTSNALTFTVTNPNPIPCTTYPYYNCPPVGAPFISFLTPSSGVTGTQVTITGSGFSFGGNNIYFGNQPVAYTASQNGTTLTFTVPSTFTYGYGTYPVTPGTYPVTVRNSQGVVSNAVNFTVTGNTSTSAPVITSVSGPTSLSQNQQGTWSVAVDNRGNTYTTVSVRWGDEHLYPYTASPAQTMSLSGTQTFTFTHAYAQAGTYTVTFTVTGQGGTNTSTQTVTVGGTTNNVVLSYISPTSGRVGTQVVLKGSGFTQSNVVRFSSGGQANVASFDGGTTIYYTIPAWITPCDPEVYCIQQAIPVMPGTHPIFVRNQNGTSQTLYFTVVQ